MTDRLAAAEQTLSDACGVQLREHRVRVAPTTSGRIPEALFAWYASLMWETSTARNLCAEVAAMATPFGFRAGSALTPADLASIQAPLLYLWGEVDTFASLQHADTLSAATPGARVVRYDGFGHLPWLDDPARIAADMNAFLDA